MYHKDETERLVNELNDEQVREDYKRPYDNHTIHFLPHVVGATLVFFGDVVYGKKPSYNKFRAIEVIARVPYQSWVSAAYTLLTLFYSNEQKAIELSHVSKYARLAHDNETMHVVVISALAREQGKSNVLTYTVIPMLFAFLYFWASYVLYLLSPRYSHEVNYLFENHAFEQYSEFLSVNETELRERPISSEFLHWYGRYPRNQYEFFELVRNDELIHRNTSAHVLVAGI